MAERVDAPQHTGLQRRLEEAEEEPERLDEPLAPAGGAGRPRGGRPGPPARTLELTLREYRAHVEVDGRARTPGGRVSGRRRGSATRNRGSRWLASFRQRAVAQSVPRWVQAFA